MSRYDLHSSSTFFFIGEHDWFTGIKLPYFRCDKSVQYGKIHAFNRCKSTPTTKRLLNKIYTAVRVCVCVWANCTAKCAEYWAYCRLIVIEFVLTFCIAHCLPSPATKLCADGRGGHVSMLRTTKWMFALFYSWIFTTFISCNKKNTLFDSMRAIPRACVCASHQENNKTKAEKSIRVTWACNWDVSTYSPVD